MSTPVAALDEPYAPLPGDAHADDVERYRRNFLQAVRDRHASEHLSPMERLVRKEISIYLAANYDPRPLEQVADDVRSVITSQVARR